MDRTLGIIKPDAVAERFTGAILRRIEEEGLDVVALRRSLLSQREAESFYFVHKAKPFFGSLIDFMTSGPCVIMVLEGKNAVERWRNLMGPTNPVEAPHGSVRREFGRSIEKNAVHGSDSPENAATEIFHFFKETELHTPDPQKVAKSGSDG